MTKKLNLKSLRPPLVGTLFIFGSSSAAMPALAQEEPVMEEVYITGSLIKRSEESSALPVQFITSEDIQRIGVTNAEDLMTKLPVMQGFYTSSDSVGGSGGGIVSASLRGLGAEYTLVLLNGRRMAPADSGSAIDLSNIPVSAIERVEVLTDGASALYGSDAIAGVVNFILKENYQGFEIGGRVDLPEESGGEKTELHLTFGFGDYDDDGFNVMVALSHDAQEQLAASDRDFAKTGILYFEHPGYEETALFFNGSPNSIPGNARARYIDDDTGEEETLIFNPYLMNNSGCPTQTSQIGSECWFDYTSTIEILPEYERNSLFGQADFRLTDDLKIFASLLLSQNELTARIAPYPTGYVRLYDSDDDATIPDLVASEIMPLLSASEADGGFGLSATELASVTSVDGRWRALPAGNRTTEYITDSINFSIGLEGAAGDIEYQVTATQAVTEIEQNYPTGWLLLDEFVDAVSSGAFNIFAGQEDFTDADAAALAPTVYHGNWDTTKVTMTMLDAHATMPLFDLAGGEAAIAFGADYRSTSYDRDIAEANANEALLFLSPDTPYDFSRDQYGVFTELGLPVLDNLELNASLRYDNIGAVEDKLNGGDVNDSSDDITYKLNLMWTITDTLAMRASYGTGFKSPTMRQIGEPLSDFGVTSGTFACPFAAGDPLAAYCLSGEGQYGVYRQGTATLKPETSTQYTAGLVFQPGTATSMSVDYWKLEMEDLVERLQESQIFGNPVLYRDLFTTRTNQGTGEEELAIIQQAVNVGEETVSGIDYKVATVFDFDGSSLESTFRGTYIIESESSLTGSSLGRFGADDEVVFRNIFIFTNTLLYDDISHTLTWNYRSGYVDQFQYANLLDENGDIDFDAEVDVQLAVPSYSTFDYLFQWNLMDDALDLNVGINNILDNEPPLSLRVSGSGHQVGWDPRYSDAYGRTYYVAVSYAFW